MTATRRPAELLFRGVSSSPLSLMDKVFGSLAQRIQIALMPRVSEDISVRASEMRTTTFGSALTVLDGGSERGVYAIMRFPPGRTPGFIAFQAAMLRPIIQRMLGDEDLTPAPDDERPLSPVELCIANRLCRTIEGAVAAELRAETDLGVVFEPLTHGPRHVDDADMGTTTAICTLDFGVDGELGQAVLCLPAAVVERMIVQQPTTKRDSKAPSASRMQDFHGVEVELVVSHDMAPMTIRQIRELEVGQTVFVSGPDLCAVTVNGRRLGRAQLGESNGARAVRLVERY